MQYIYLINNIIYFENFIKDFMRMYNFEKYFKMGKLC